MSKESNTILFERAADMIDTWEGTLIAKLIEYDIDTNDLDELRKHVQEAEAMVAEEEFRGHDIY